MEKQSSFIRVKLSSSCQKFGKKFYKLFIKLFFEAI